MSISIEKSRILNRPTSHIYERIHSIIHFKSSSSSLSRPLEVLKLLLMAATNAPIFTFVRNHDLIVRFDPKLS